MADDNNFELDDRLQSLLAQTHHIQNRLLQCAGRGAMSVNIREELKRHLDSMGATLGNIE